MPDGLLKEFSTLSHNTINKVRDLYFLDMIYEYEFLREIRILDSIDSNIGLNYVPKTGRTWLYNKEERTISFDSLVFCITYLIKNAEICRNTVFGS